MNKITRNTTSKPINFQRGLTTSQFLRAYGGRCYAAYHEACHIAVNWWIGATTTGCIVDNGSGVTNAVWTHRPYYKLYNDACDTSFPVPARLHDTEDFSDAWFAWDKAWTNAGVVRDEHGERFYGAILVGHVMRHLAGEIGEEVILGLRHNLRYDTSLGTLWGDYKSLKKTLADYNIVWKSADAEALLVRCRQLLRDVFRQPAMEAIVHTVADALLTTEQYGKRAGMYGYYLTREQIDNIIDAVTAPYEENAASDMDATHK
jgi:hypothetical protein